MKITINKPTEFEAVYLKVDAGVPLLGGCKSKRNKRR